MPKYNYRAADKTGREINSSIEADNKTQATEELKRQGLIIINLNEQNLLSQDINIGFLEQKPKPRDMSVFCRQFVSIIDAGVSVIATLEMLAEQTENKLLRRTITETKRSIERGESLANAMRPHNKVFSDIFITMVEAGEASGSLDVSFSRMAEQFEKEAHLKGLMRKATIYPALVSFVAVAVVIAMLTFVIPTFQDMFKDMGIELPGITKFVIGLSELLQQYFILIILGIIGLVVFIKYFSTTEVGKRVFGKLSMKLPLFGNLTVKSASSQMSRTLSTLIGAGIPLIDALEITASTMPNIYFQEALLDARDSVAMGTSLSEPLTHTRLFPPLVCHMIKIGEETGGIDSMLTRLANYYDDEVELATQSLMAALEPLIIILLAGIIGTIVMAVMLPMASMYQGMENL